jgi:hypothetical protein
MFCAIHEFMFLEEYSFSRDEPSQKGGRREIRRSWSGMSPGEPADGVDRRRKIVFQSRADAIYESLLTAE